MEYLIVAIITSLIITITVTIFLVLATLLIRANATDGDIVKFRIDGSTVEGEIVRDMIDNLEVKYIKDVNNSLVIGHIIIKRSDIVLF